MKPTFVISFLLNLSLLSYGQTRELTDEDYNSSGAIKLIFETEIPGARELARQDIEKGTPFLLIQSGIAPVVYTTDGIFESQYKAYYYEQGDVAPNTQLITAYNIEIFKFLDDQYGRKWRESIRRDVIGFKKWRRRN